MKEVFEISDDGLSMADFLYKMKRDRDRDLVTRCQHKLSSLTSEELEWAEKVQAYRGRKREGYHKKRRLNQGEELVQLEKEALARLDFDVSGQHGQIKVIANGQMKSALEQYFVEGQTKSASNAFLENA
jgi:hypothetical protein